MLELRKPLILFLKKVPNVPHLVPNSTEIIFITHSAEIVIKSRAKINI